MSRFWWMKYRVGRFGVPVGAIIALVLGAVVVLAIVLPFTQNAPPTPAGSVLTTNCAGPALPLTQNGPTSIRIGSAGTVLYTCGAPPSATTAAFSAGTGTATPTFTLPAAGTVGLSIMAHSATATTCVAGTALTSAAAVNFGGPAPAPPVGDYDYCLSYTAYPSAGIAAFTVSWA